MDSSTPFIRSGLASFGQPAAIAAFASVGIHALFAVNIEKIALFPRTAQLPPSVGLVELSADQVGGIYPPPAPQFGLSDAPLPPSISSLFGRGPALPEFPLNAPPPPAPESFASVPQDSYIFIPADPSNISRGTNLPPVVSRQRQSSPESSPDTYTFGTFPIPPNLPINTPPSPPTTPEQDNIVDKNAQELERMRDFQQQLESGEITFSQAPPDPNIFNPPRTSSDEPGSKLPYPKGLDDLAANNVESPQPSSPDGRGSILEGLQEGLNQEENRDVAANTGNPRWTLEQSQQSSEGQLSERELAQTGGGSSYANWVLSLQESYPDIQPASPIPISDMYPVEACEQQLSGRVLVGVVIGSGGEILAGPELLLNTGYAVLDNEAVQRVREFVTSQASGGGTPTAYQYAFEFNSENCGNVSSPEEAAPATAQPPVENNSTPGEIELQEGLEETTVEPSEELSETEALETEPAVEPSEELSETEALETEPAVEPSEELSETEVLETPSAVEPSEELSETEALETELPAEPSQEVLEMEVLETETEALETEPAAEPSEEFSETETLQTEPLLEDVQPDAMPSEFEEPVENSVPAE